MSCGDFWGIVMSLPPGLHLSLPWIIDRSTVPPACPHRYLSYIYYGLGILLYIEFDGGNRTLYTCVEQGGTDVCTPTNPGSPETDPTCHPTTE